MMGWQAQNACKEPYSETRAVRIGPYGDVQNAAGSDCSSLSCTTHDQPRKLSVGTQACMHREKKGSFMKQCCPSAAQHPE